MPRVQVNQKAARALMAEVAAGRAGSPLPAAHSPHAVGLCHQPSTINHQQFSLVIEYNTPVAAIIPQRLSAPQLRTIFALRPRAAGHDAELARRWNVEIVCCTNEWARQQKERVPMTRPRDAVSLSFS